MDTATNSHAALKTRAGLTAVRPVSVSIDGDAGKIVTGVAGVESGAGLTPWSTPASAGSDVFSDGALEGGRLARPHFGQRSQASARRARPSSGA